MAGSTHAPSPALTHRQVRRLGRALPRRLVLTREGKLFILLTVGIGFAAINSGNNLLYLVFGLLLSLILVSGLLSEANLRGLTALRHPAPQLEAGTPSLAAVTLTNPKRRLPSYGVEVHELLPAEAADVWGARQRRGYVLVLPPGGSQTAYVRLTAARRGVLTSAGLRVSTRFPFGLFEKSRFFPLPARFTALPAARPSPLDAVRPAGHGLEEHLAGVGSGDELHGLRDHRAGDDARTIAWKVSARRDRLVVREHERPGTRKVVLVFANVVPADLPPAADAAAREALEAAITRVAGLASAYLEAGWAVGLATCDGGLSPEAGRALLPRIGELLAQLPVRAAPQGAQPPLWDGASDRAAGPAGRRAERVAVVTTAQQRAGLAPAADRVVVADADDAATTREAAA